MTTAGQTARRLSLRPPVLGVSRFALDTTQEGPGHSRCARGKAEAGQRQEGLTLTRWALFASLGESWVTFTSAVMRVLLTEMFPLGRQNPDVRDAHSIGLLRFAGNTRDRGDT